MLLTQEIAPSASQRDSQSAELPQVDEQLAGSFVIRDVPVILHGAEKVSSPGRLSLHYGRLHVEGIAALIPAAIEIDVTAIAAGGQIRIDELPMPPCCEVIGVWFANPIVTVECPE